MVIIVMVAVVVLAPIVVKVLVSTGVVINTSLEILAIGVNANVFAVAMVALESTIPAPGEEFIC